jgi:methyl-accepting chemotaxis protein
MNSKNTSQLKSALSALHYKLNHKEMDRLHVQKGELDQRADEHRYAYIANRRDDYQQLSEDFDGLNAYIKERMTDVKKSSSELL